MLFSAFLQKKKKKKREGKKTKKDRNTSLLSPGRLQVYLDSIAIGINGESQPIVLATKR